MSGIRGMFPGMRTKDENMNLPFQKEYKAAMRSLFAGMILIAASMGVSALSTSCSNGSLATGIKLPFDLGVRYQVEPGVFIVATPGDKGGLDLSLDAPEGIGENLTRVGDVWTYSSPRTGNVYRITKRDNGRPLIEIVKSGDGKLQLVPAPVPDTPQACLAPKNLPSQST